MKENEELPSVFQQIDEIFGSHGLLAGGLLSYNLRPGQIDMSKLVAEALEDNRILMVEAGTGTGKTLAYLVPSIIWAWENQDRVVISTNTVNLQDQIWNQDIPMLQELLPYDFSAIRLKGRSNYLCLRKWSSGYQLTLGEDLNEDFHDRLEKWVQTTETGDKSELNLSSFEDSFWQKNSADDYSCHGSKCRWSKDCFLRKVRAAASRANIILVNHSLLLTDAGGSFGILPEFSKLIIDEAHNLSSTAVNQFSLSIDRGELLETYNKLGQVTKLARQQLKIQEENSNTFQEQLDSFDKNRSDFFRLLSGMYSDAASFYSENSQGKKLFRVQPVLHGAYIEVVFRRCHEFLEAVGKIKKNMDFLEETVEEFQDRDEVRITKNAVDSARKKFLELSQYDEKEQVLWLEEEPDKEVSIHTAPLNAGNILTDILYSRLDSVILTSATLRLRNSFEYFSRELGLSLLEDVLYEKVLPAFDFSSQAKIFIADDLPEPDWKNDTSWVEASAATISKVALACSGNILALFTSHRHLLLTYELIKNQLKKEGIRVLAHDIDGDRYNLVQAIKGSEKTLLLGTGSFWEGIDVPGNRLQCVIINKLPFPVPDSPLFEAKVEKARAMGENPFTSLFLPLCTTRLLQGIGRLIRSENDFGFVVILDRRLISKGYACFIIDSLPAEPLIMGTEEICAAMEEMISIEKNRHPAGN